MIGSRCAEKQNTTAGRNEYLGLWLFLLYWLMRTPLGITDLITAHRQHVSLSFINDTLEFCVGNVGFCVVQHVMRRRVPLILKKIGPHMVRWPLYNVTETVLSWCYFGLACTKQDAGRPAKNVVWWPFHQHKERAYTILMESENGSGWKGP